MPVLWLLSGVQLATQKRGEGQAFSPNWLVWWRVGQIASTGGKAAWGMAFVPFLQQQSFWACEDPVCVFVFGLVDKSCYLVLLGWGPAL